MIDVDPEILFAAALGTTLAKMRAELSEEAIKRIMLFVLDRYGIELDAFTLRIRAMPIERTRIIERPTVQDVFPVAVPEPATVEAIHRAACPICAWGTLTEKGLNIHMHNKHGVTLKEYRRQKALDVEEGGE